MIELRPLLPAHAPSAENFLAAVMESAPALSRWMPWYHAGYGLADVERWYGEAQRMWTEKLAYPMLIVDVSRRSRTARHPALWQARSRDGVLGAAFGMRSGRCGDRDAIDGRVRLHRTRADPRIDAHPAR
jgi:hypothetical protein